MFTSFFLISLSAFIAWVIYCTENQTSCYVNPEEPVEYSYHYTGDTTTSNQLYLGEQIYNRECASCHFLNMDMIGPALKGAVQRGRENAFDGWIYAFVQNQDSLIQIEDLYTLNLKEVWGSSKWNHQFDYLKRTQVDQIFCYIEGGYGCVVSF